MKEFILHYIRKKKICIISMSKKTLKNKMKTKYRIESDVLGEIKVEDDKYWGAETQRSIIHFSSIGQEKIPTELIITYAMYKKCAAITNKKLKLFKHDKIPNVIIKVCDEIMSGKMEDQFPLHVWQTGSGTHTNMNVNEVISNRCIEILKGKKGSKSPVHPNDDVNKSQSSNDSFPTVLYMTTALLIHKKLLYSVEYLIKGLKIKTNEFKNDIKIGRTHLQDATPISFGQEFSGYVALIEDSHDQIKKSLEGLYELPAGGTAVGTGINTDPKYGTMVVSEIRAITRLPFKSAKNKFSILSSHNAILICSSSLMLLATNLRKIAEDIRWMASGPKTGLKEIILPANEPGSSIMPGKINPSQCEATLMVYLKVMGNHTEIVNANSQGNFELNTYNPLMAYNIIQSIKLLNDICINLTDFCISGIQINKKQIQYNVDNALTIVTALNPYIGYDNASKLARYALEHDISLRESNKTLKIMDDQLLVQRLDVSKMI